MGGRGSFGVGRLMGMRVGRGVGGSREALFDEILIILRYNFQHSALIIQIIIKLKMSWRSKLMVQKPSPQDPSLNTEKCLGTQKKDSDKTGYDRYSLSLRKLAPRNLSATVLENQTAPPKLSFNFKTSNPNAVKNLFCNNNQSKGLIKNLSPDFGFNTQVPKARRKLNLKEEKKFTEELVKFPVFNINNLKMGSPQKFVIKKNPEGVSVQKPKIKLPPPSIEHRKPQSLNQPSFPFQRIAPTELKFNAPKKDDFQIGKVLGKGQYGQVMIVRHKKTGFLCAMKVMAKKVIREENYINQIVRELSIQFYLSHRNIAPLYGYFYDSENIYLLVEFCQGGQLYNKIKKQKRLEQKQTSQIIKQVLQGLDYIHKQQIIHRDLKPQNILFTNDVVKISDFGWAVFSNDGFRKTASGSPLYYPPQIVKGELYDQKIDLWNVGMMTYQCLLGKIPFRIYSELDLDKIVSDQITFPDYVDVSETAKDFILKTMRKNADERMEIREMLRHKFIKQFDSKSYLPGPQQEFNKLML